MSKPMQGKTYTVVDENTLSQVALRAYGDASKWTLIFKANKTTLKSGNPDLIYPGEILIIPVLADLDAYKKSVISKKEKDDFTLVLDGLEVKVESAKIATPLDTIGDQCNCVVAWNPGENKELDKRLLPYKYTSAEVYLGNERMIKGFVYLVEPEMTETGIKKHLTIFSKTIDLMDSDMMPPYEFNNIKLSQLAKNLVSPLGFNVVFDVVDNYIFDRLTASDSDKIGSFLLDKARQRQILLSSNSDGDLVFTKAKKTKSIGILEEGQPLPVGWAAKYDGRERFNAYKVISTTPFDVSQFAIAKDANIPKTRFRIKKADDSQLGSLQSVAEWERSKQLADALTMPFPVTKWYAPDGKLWRNNTIVTIKSKTLDIPNGVDLLIRNVEFDYKSDGETATLSLVPYQVFSGEKLDDIWQV